MNVNQLLKPFSCECGKVHRCDIEAVYIEKGAVRHLAELCSSVKTVLLVADENTFAAAGEAVRQALCDKTLEEVIFSGKTVLIPDEVAIERVREALDGVEMMVGVGSGVIQDLCKCVSHYTKIPYMIVATAPSMDGYASNGAAMILKGMKETVSAGLPRAILADTEVLKNAPMEMIRAGYGDIIGKYSALCDWKLSRVVKGEYFCPYIYQTTLDIADQIRRDVDGIMNRNEESIRFLAEALVVVGVMMSFATTSRPASGSEHHLSHFFEIVGIVDGKPYYPHGIDVAYSTVVTAQLREEILKRDFPRQSAPRDRAKYLEDMKRIYGPVAEGCVALQDRVGHYAQDRTGVYLEKEEEIRRLLAECPGAEEIKGMLSAADFNMEEFYDFYGKEKIRTAIRYAKDLKDRYTVLWLYDDLFGGDR